MADEFKFNLGDVVAVGGYEGRAFQIEGRRREYCEFPGEAWTDVVYEMTDVRLPDWLEADEEDIKLLAPADGADEYIASLPATPGVKFMADLSAIDWFGMEAEDMKKPERKPTARELSGIEADKRKAARKEKAKEVDRLLDEYNDYGRLAVQFGDKEYAEKQAVVLAQLKALSEAE